MDYFIKRINLSERYFYQNGLYMEKQGRCELIGREAKDVFCAFENDSVVHVIFVNQKNELVYIPKKDRKNKEYVLCELKEGFNVRNMKIAKSKDRLNLLYSALYGDEILLIHCVLGNHARPSVIDKLESEYFFPYGDRVYYTNKSGIMGYQELTDGKPDRFVSVEEGAVMPYLCCIDEKEYIVYKKDTDICVNHTPKTQDKYAFCPVLKRGKNVIELVWQCGGALKYSELDGAGNPKRIISSKSPCLSSIQDGENVYYDYDVNKMNNLL